MNATTESLAGATAAAVLRAAADALRVTGVDGPQRHAELLLAAAWETDRTGLHLRADEALPQTVQQRFFTMLQRRLAREPLQYILGSWGFWSIDVAVDPAVLIPRPETELLVERAIAIGTKMGPATNTVGEVGTVRIADVGTGSGCIAIALAAELRAADIWATDVSPRALAVAAANAERNAVAGRIRFVEGDLCDGLPAATFDVVVSNPPYVATAELATLEPELSWEPRSALDGGADGLDVIRRLVPAAAAVVRPGGMLLIEIGIDQGDAVVGILRQGPWRDVLVRDDLSGRPRVVEARRSGGD